MDDIVKYQLKRAAASGGTGLGTAPVERARNAGGVARRAAQGLRRARYHVRARAWPKAASVHRRPRRPDRDCRQPARQRVQVGTQPGAPEREPPVQPDGAARRSAAESSRTTARAFRRTSVSVCSSAARDWTSASAGRASVCRSCASWSQLNGGTITIGESALGGARIEVASADLQAPVLPYSSRCDLRLDPTTTASHISNVRCWSCAIGSHLTRYADRPRLARELDRLFARKAHRGPDVERQIRSLTPGDRRIGGARRALAALAAAARLRRTRCRSLRIARRSRRR